MLATSLRKYAFSVKAFNSAKNYYKILNLSETANQTDIKKAYRLLAKKYHPDTNHGKQEQFKQINEAYQVLSSQTTKSQYDQDRKTSNPTNSHQQSYHPNPHYDHNQRRNYHPNQSNYQYYQQYQYQKGPQYENHSGKYSGWNNMDYQQRVMYEMLKQQQTAEFIRRFYQQHQNLKRKSHFEYNFQNQREEDYIRKYNEARKKQQERDQKRYEEQYEQYLRNMQKEEQHRKQMMDKIPQTITSGLKSVASLAKELWNLWKNKGEHKK